MVEIKLKLIEKVFIVFFLTINVQRIEIKMNLHVLSKSQ